MKLKFYNVILTASAMAALVGCSARSHLYCSGNVIEHNWQTPQSAYCIIQYTTPFDAAGNDISQPGAKPARWQTYTQVTFAYHEVTFPLPVWALSAVATSVLGAALCAAFWLSRRPSRSKEPA
jgi:hypothetical protein